MSNHERRSQEFIEFLVGFIRELNDLSREGSVVLVEGKRDATALSDLGYVGEIVTRSTLMTGRAMVERAKSVIILTDLDAEGRRLASGYIKLFSRMGVSTTLAARKRLSRASHGRFLHIENLDRFAPLLLSIGDAVDLETARQSPPQP